MRLESMLYSQVALYSLKKIHSRQKRKLYMEEGCAGHSLYLIQRAQHVIFLFWILFSAYVYCQNVLWLMLRFSLCVNSLKVCFNIYALQFTIVCWRFLCMKEYNEPLSTNQCTRVSAFGVFIFYYFHTLPSLSSSSVCINTEGINANRK